MLDPMRNFKLLTPGPASSYYRHDSQQLPPGHYWDYDGSMRNDATFVFKQRENGWAALARMQREADQSHELDRQEFFMEHGYWPEQVGLQPGAIPPAIYSNHRDGWGIHGQRIDAELNPVGQEFNEPTWAQMAIAKGRAMQSGNLEVRVVS